MAFKLQNGILVPVNSTESSQESTSNIVVARPSIIVPEDLEKRIAVAQGRYDILEVDRVAEVAGVEPRDVEIVENTNGISTVELAGATQKSKAEKGPGLARSLYEAISGLYRTLAGRGSQSVRDLYKSIQGLGRSLKTAGKIALIVGKKAAYVAPAVILAGCGAAHSYGRTSHSFEPAEEMPWEVGLGAGYRDGSNEITGPMDPQTWHMRGSEFEIGAKGSIWGDYLGSSTRFRLLEVILIADYSRFKGNESSDVSGPTGWLGDITDLVETEGRILVGAAYGHSSKGKVELALGYGGESDKVEFGYGSNTIIIDNGRGGFEIYVGGSLTTDKFELKGGYSYTSLNGSEKTDVLAGGVPVSSEERDVEGGRHIIYALPTLKYDKGETAFLLRYTSTDSDAPGSMYDWERGEFDKGVIQRFNPDGKVIPYISLIHTDGTKESEGAKEDIGKWRLDGGVTFSF